MGNLSTLPAACVRIGFCFSVPENLYDQEWHISGFGNQYPDESTVRVPFKYDTSYVTKKTRC